MKELNLRQYRPVSSYSYSGRPQGEKVREKLNLSEIDKSNEEVEFIIPSDTTSFNPSFFLGLLYESIQSLGLDKFNSKYTIKVETEDPERRKFINSNIEDGFRHAYNSINKKTGLSFL
ncbi:hypothetical protein ACFE6N_22820 [Pedobacter sp. BG31]|uniref:hypothetical protein n=1 Tax=Pedobacter sp. BG31 TaxID=3349697 RepID=UPI0035F3CC69